MQGYLWKNKFGFSNSLKMKENKGRIDKDNETILIKISI